MPCRAIVTGSATPALLRNQASQKLLHQCPFLSRLCMLSPCQPHSLQVDRALKTLTRVVRTGGVLKELRGQEFNIKRAEKRVLDAKESARRKSKRFFKLQMNAIAHRQAQCVTVLHSCIPVTSLLVPLSAQGILRSFE